MSEIDRNIIKYSIAVWLFYGIVVSTMYYHHSVSAKDFTVDIECNDEICEDRLEDILSGYEP